MSRTTVDIDAPILRDLKRLQKEERKSLGRLISDLLGQALGLRRANKKKGARFVWHAQALGLRVDLEDKEAVWAILDEDMEKRHRR